MRRMAARQGMGDPRCAQRPSTTQHLGHAVRAQPEGVRQARAQQRAQIEAEGVGDVGARGADELVLHLLRMRAGMRLPYCAL